jgi:dipeptidyl aminopeptidase/acylaminoacyl peptidase
MGLIKNPEIFRCGVEWVGVTDINLMYSITWSDASYIWKEAGMPELIGDRVKDAVQLETTSPLKQAARLTQPLLMAYGTQDRRVPIKHGTAFRDAVVKTNPNVEWIEYPGEGHGFYLTQNRVDFWTRVEAFFARNLRGGGGSALAESAAR